MTDARLLSRRALLAALGSGLATAALAEAPLTSLRPVARGGGGAPAPEVSARRPVARPTTEELIAAAGLTGTVALALADARTGELLYARNAAAPLPPASVTKALTALWGLEGLGPTFRFTTRLLATGALSADGTLAGDLILTGNGDPVLTTDHLAEMADALAAAGITRIDGRFLVHDTALPRIDRIDPGQLDQLGYNPGLSGLNANFNRVHFEWDRTATGYDLKMDGRTERHRPEVRVARMALSEAASPIYTYRNGGTFDAWTVARPALGEAGARWLPVRHPGLYAGDLLRSLCATTGLDLPAPQRIDALPPGTRELVRHRSGPLLGILRGMLRYSTNLTAEVVGLTASTMTGERPETLAGSAERMTGWLNRSHGTGHRFVDHSGLGDDSRVTALDLVRSLTAPGVATRLRPILRNIPFLDAEGAPIRDHPVRVLAKTGTLNFVSTLAGYIDRPEGPPLAFAFLAGDLDARARIEGSLDEVPAGVRGFNARAKDLQRSLLARWGAGLTA